MENSRAGRPYTECGIAEKGGWLYTAWVIAELGGSTLVLEQQSRAGPTLGGEERA